MFRRKTFQLLRYEGNGEIMYKTNFVWNFIWMCNICCVFVKMINNVLYNLCASKPLRWFKIKINGLFESIYLFLFVPGILLLLWKIISLYCFPFSGSHTVLLGSPSSILMAPLYISSLRLSFRYCSTRRLFLNTFLPPIK